MLTTKRTRNEPPLYLRQNAKHTCVTRDIAQNDMNGWLSDDEDNEIHDAADDEVARYPELSNTEKVDPL